MRDQVVNNSNPVKLAISTCPNDTFAFHAILNNKIDLQGMKFEIQLLDIQELNSGLLAGQFEVAKVSFHAALQVADEITVLPSGSALGFGVGPLLLAAQPATSPGTSIDSGQQPLTLCPGSHTTAYMLFRLFYGMDPPVEHVVFSDIMPALKNQRAGFGVCIHEGRFTWESQGLHLVEDLGTRWETETQSPLPLGGIVIRNSVEQERIRQIQNIIRDSIQYGLSHRQETIPTMKRYAQELDDKVLLQHVDLYVNQWTVELGDAGRKALHTLSDKAVATGLTGNASDRLGVFEV